MSTASFGVQKASFMASWTVLVDNYMARKSDDKLDSLEKNLDVSDCNDSRLTLANSVVNSI